MSSYRYFDGLAAGEPLWTASEFDANHLVQSNVGEMSVMYNEAVGQWTMMYFNELRAAIELRQAPEPWGPWSAPLTITTSAQTPGGMYAPYMNPLYVENGGQTVYFTMSLWNTYDVYLAKATFRIVPEPSTALLAFAGVTVFLWCRCRRPLLNSSPAVTGRLASNDSVHVDLISNGRLQRRSSRIEDDSGSVQQVHAGNVVADGASASGMQGTGRRLRRARRSLPRVRVTSAQPLTGEGQIIDTAATVRATSPTTFIPKLLSKLPATRQKKPNAPTTRAN